MNATTDVLDCQRYVHDALIAAAKDRTADDWIDHERFEIALAANNWAVAHGYAGRITVANVERLEQSAIGHADYASKIALYVAEAVVLTQGATK